MDNTLPTLMTPTPEAGFQLAVKLARLGIRTTQPDEAVRARMRPVYSESTADLIASSHVIAVHFQTVAAANNYWR